MLTNPQKSLLKRAQLQAGIADAEYRETLGRISGLASCQSSTDARLTDAHLDNLLAFFEAIYWSRVDAGELPGACKANAPFRQRGYWAQRNRRGNNSRDRFNAVELGRQIQALEEEMYGLGYSLAYLQAIQVRIEPFSLPAYLGALTRTLKAKRNQAVASRL